MAQSPFPNATDYAFPASTVQSLIAPFIVSCPYNVAAILPTIPVVIPVPAPNSGYVPNNTSAQIAANDISALNYALTLEYLEATYYNKYLGTPGYDQTAFLNAGLSFDDYSYFQMIQLHENIHVIFLTSTINSLGGTPVPNCTYNFAGHVTSLQTFISTAGLLENTGVTAYDGAVNTLFDPALRQAAATVATIEGRHASFLNQLVNTSAFPGNFDTPVGPQSVVSEVLSAGFIVSCPVPPPIPVSIVVTPYNSQSGPPTGSASGSASSSAPGSTSGSSAHLATTTSDASTLVVLSAVFFMTLVLLL